MATYYWVGGSGNWDTSDTSHWASSSGGAGGAGVPSNWSSTGIKDHVIFDQAGTYTVTIGAGTVFCDNITVSAGSPTFSTGNIGIVGNTSLNATTTMNATIYYWGTGTGKTIGMNGATLGANIYFSDTGGWVLTSNLVMLFYATIYLDKGSLDFNGYDSTFGYLNAFNNTTLTRTLSMGSGTHTMYGGLNVNATNFVFNCGTSHIRYNVTYLNGLQFTGMIGFTFYDVTNISNGAVAGGTYRNLTLDRRAGENYIAYSDVGGNVTVTGTLAFTGTGPQLPWCIRSNNGYSNTGYTMTVAAISGASDLHFQGITIAGAVAPISVTRGGDMGYNSGIIFPSAKTVYWNHASNTSWCSTSWATTSSGTPAINNQPLPQDTAILGNTTMPSTWGFGNNVVGTVDFSPLANAVTLTFGLYNTIFYGSLTLNSNITLDSYMYLIFTCEFRSTSGSITFTTAGKTIPHTLNINVGSGSFTLVGNLSLYSSAYAAYAPTEQGEGELIFTRGTFNTGNYTITARCMHYNNQFSWTRTLNLGSSTINLTHRSGFAYTFGGFGAGGTTVNTGTSKIRLTYSGTAVGGGLIQVDSVGDIYDLELAMTGVGNVVLIGNVLNFNSITSSSPTAQTLKFWGNTTYIYNIGSWGVSGTAGNVMSITGHNGSLAVLKKSSPWKVGVNSTVSSAPGFKLVAGDGVDYLSFTNINGSPVDAVGNLFFGSNF